MLIALLLFLEGGFLFWYPFWQSEQMISAFIEIAMTRIAHIYKENEM